MKEESEKAGLKLNSPKTKIMDSGSITSWKTDGGKNGNSNRFIFLGSKITADCDCSHEIQTLAPWKESYDQPRQYSKKQRYHLLTKVHLVKAMVFPIVTNGCENLNMNMKAECQELMLLNHGLGEDSWESVRQQGDQTSQS